MSRTLALVFVAGLATPALSQEISLDDRRTIDGIVTIMYAQEPCGFELNDDQLAEYMRSRTLLSPDAMAYLDVGLSYKKAMKAEVSSAECAIQKATAAEIGVLR